jgi:RNA polymerase sigma factor (sigma-70 family)
LLEHAALESGPQAPDDDALMARVATRDGQAFRLLAERHSVMLHRLAYRMLGEGAAAEDITQETLLKLWDQAGRWPGKGPGVGAWLRRVATNACLDRLRRAKFISGNEIPERADESPLADEVMDGERVRKAVIEAMGTLPDRQRAAIVLTYYEAQSNADAATTLEMNIKAFESLLLRARAGLKAALIARGITEGGAL